jgi:hypothetical protein
MFHCVGFAPHFTPSLVPCACIMSLSPGKKICAAFLETVNELRFCRFLGSFEPLFDSNSLFFKLFRYLLFFMQIIYANPFVISFSENKEPNQNDYKILQNTLRAIPQEPIRQLLAMDADADFPLGAGRVYCGINLGIIDVDRGFFPIQKLQKIGRGGTRCIVSYSSYNKKYPELLSSIVQGLEECNFDGYFYYRIGGFPNPTGNELRYAGVPMSFKVFMMQEAEQLGFNTILWLDASMYPLKDLTPLFEHIEQRGYLLHGWPSNPEHSIKTISPLSRKILRTLTGIDVIHCTYLQLNLFGLQLNTPKAKELMSWLLYCIDLGTPFLSWWPEEPVFGALIAWLAPTWHPSPKFHIRCTGDGSNAHIQQMKKENTAFFYYRPH